MRQKILLGLLTAALASTAMVGGTWAAEGTGATQSAELATVQEQAPAPEIRLGEPRWFGGRQVSGPAGPKLRVVDKIPATTAKAAAKGKHPLRCWTQGMRRDLTMRFGVVWVKVGELFHRVFWCHDGVKVSANWREAGGYITWLNAEYQGHKKLVKNVTWEIRMAVRHEIKVDYKIWHMTLHPCTQTRHGDGLISARADCDLG